MFVCMYVFQFITIALHNLNIYFYYNVINLLITFINLNSFNNCFSFARVVPVIHTDLKMLFSEHNDMMDLMIRWFDRYQYFSVDPPFAS